MRWQAFVLMFFDGLRSERQLLAIAADRLSMRRYLGDMHGTSPHPAVPDARLPVNIDSGLLVLPLSMTHTT